MGPLMINMHRNKYKNTDSANNLIRYITRTRPNEDKLDELISYGFASGYTYCKSIDEVIKEFEFVQQFYKAKDCLMCHYVIHISPELYACMNNDITKINNYGRECCEYLFTLGFQSCYAIHNSKSRRLHIHLAINSVNFTTGYKIRQYPAEIKKNIEYPLIKLLEKYSYTTVDSMDFFESC